MNVFCVVFTTLLVKVVYGGMLSTFQVDNSNQRLLPNDVSGTAYAQTQDRLFVFGGRSGSANPPFDGCAGECDDMFIFDFGNETWTTMHHALPEGFYCYENCAVTMPDGLIYIMGHTGDTWGEVFRFNTSNLQFEESILMPFEYRSRAGCVASDYENGIFYYFGG
eukprot:553581_1